MGSQRAGHKWATLTFWFCKSTFVDLHTGTELLGHRVLRYIVLRPQCLSAPSSGQPRCISVSFSPFPRILARTRYCPLAALVIKNLPASAEDVRSTGSIPVLGRSLGGGHSNPLQYSYLENPMDRGAWWATIHRVAQSQIWLKCLSTYALCWYLPTWMVSSSNSCSHSFSLITSVFEHGFNYIFLMCSFLFSRLLAHTLVFLMKLSFFLLSICQGFYIPDCRNEFSVQLDAYKIVSPYNPQLFIDFVHVSSIQKF